MLEREYVELVFHGLDTICDIYCNDSLVDSVSNMHTGYRYEVKHLLVPGSNEIRLEFHSPTDYFAQRDARHFVWGGDCIPGAAHLRKALYMSGWDWGPQLPDMGIFRGVEVDAYDTDAIDDVFVLQHHRDGAVELEISVTSRHDGNTRMFVQIDGQRAEVHKGKAKVTIKDPKLWWVRGYGEQNLYNLTVEMVAEGKTIDTMTKRIGLRTVTVSTVRDKYGSEFCFVVNGVKIFAMGANYIPQDNLLSRISRERTKRLLEDCVEANFNCIRVWGGGYYPEDDFYDLCDEMGLLVWQDFMVACANVWLTERFENSMVREAIYNIKRVRNHASLGILCGNNEVEAALLGWDIAKDSELAKHDYLRLYEHILPELVDEYAPHTFYWPSSPSCGGGFHDPGNKLNGDVHYWNVWHGNEPFTDYRRHLFRFCSEYGFESFPSVKTIRSFCEEKDMNPFSRVMENHQKCRSGNGKIVTYIADNYLYPTSMEKLVYTSQLLQAEAIRHGVEHFRRIRGICMGSLYWQLNDCWPVASWSSIDYFGRYKALHYAARKFYAPVAMGTFLEDDVLTVNVSNERMDAFRGSVRVDFCKNDFTVIDSTEVNVTVKKLSSADVLVLELPVLDRYSDYIAVYLFDENGTELRRQTQLMVKPKHFGYEDPHIRTVLTQRDGGVEIRLTAECFANAVEIDFRNLDCRLTDNFFDITGGDPVCVFASTGHSVQELEKELIIRSVYDIGIA